MKYFSIFTLLLLSNLSLANTPLEMSDAGHFTGIDRFNVSYAPSGNDCENCAQKPSNASANKESIVVRFAHYDTYFMDLIDNATHHDEHHLNFKLHF